MRLIKTLQLESRGGPRILDEYLYRNFQILFFFIILLKRKIEIGNLFDVAEDLYGLLQM